MAKDVEELIRVLPPEVREKVEARSAAFSETHDHHADSWEWLHRFSRTDVCCSAHRQAALFSGSPRERLTSIALNRGEYAQAAELAAASGGLHDALIG